MSEPLLQVRDLSVDYLLDKGAFRAVKNVSFDIGRGELFGLAGESGCGKSTIAYAITRLAKSPAWVAGGEILPNLVPLIGINIVGSIIYAIVAQTTLEYLGFGDPLNVTWGTMLYNAQNSSAIIVGAWWDISAPAAGIAMVGLGLALLNFTFDEIANPQLRSGPALTRWLRLSRLRKRELEAAR